KRVRARAGGCRTGSAPGPPLPLCLSPSDLPSLYLDPLRFEVLDLPVERALGDAERLGRLAAIALEAAERLRDESLLRLLDRRERAVAEEERGAGGRRLRGQRGVLFPLVGLVFELERDILDRAVVGRRVVGDERVLLVLAELVEGGRGRALERGRREDRLRRDGGGERGATSHPPDHLLQLADFEAEFEERAVEQFLVPPTERVGLRGDGQPHRGADAAQERADVLDCGRVIPDEHGGLLGDVADLADVARPVVTREEVARFG